MLICATIRKNWLCEVSAMKGNAIRKVTNVARKGTLITRIWARGREDLDMILAERQGMSRRCTN